MLVEVAYKDKFSSMLLINCGAFEVSKYFVRNTYSYKQIVRTPAWAENSPVELPHSPETDHRPSYYSMNQASQRSWTTSQNEPSFKTIFRLI